MILLQGRRSTYFDGSIYEQRVVNAQADTHPTFEKSFAAFEKLLLCLTASETSPVTAKTNVEEYDLCAIH